MCRVEVEVAKGYVSLPKRVFINGYEIPGVASVNVSYKPGDIRRVTIELMPTDFVEIDTKSEQPSAGTGTVDGP